MSQSNLVNELLKLNEEFDPAILQLTKEQCEQLAIYYERLVEWNEKMNLTAITEFQAVKTKHFLDSLSLLSHYDLKKVDTMIDVGTGAGFPGIPLKIAFPHLKVTLLDSLQKRVMFLNQVIQDCKLKNITAIHNRAEECGRDSAFREQYDLCVSRAVANLSTLTEYCIPFVKVGGQFIPYKSTKTKEEITAAMNCFKEMKAKLEDVKSFEIQGEERTLLIITKTEITPSKYPRLGGKPSKKPL